MSDANTDEAMGKMANVHPGHAFKNAPMPAAFVWELSQRSVGGGSLSKCSKLRHELQSNWPELFFLLSGIFKQGPSS